MSDASDAAYRQAGVDLAAQERALSEVARLARSTYTPAVLSDAGSFAGLFRPDFAALREPVLVASADGVGTKLTVARMAADFSTVGRDLVNHCVNDILVQGARPLFFLDYAGAGVLESETLVELVAGVAAACRENRCVLLGGETAEMPGFYQPGDYELVGFVVGAVERSQILGSLRVEVGDRLLGLPATGLHTNGYSLARRILFDDLGLDLADPFPGCNAQTVREVLLEPHPSYLPALEPWLESEGLHALAHITGGGLTDNLPRILPAGTAARLELGSWEIPPVFTQLEAHGNVDRAEMFRVFNMGIGMVAVVAPQSAEEILSGLAAAGGRALPIGWVAEGAGRVIYESPNGGWESDVGEPG